MNDQPTYPQLQHLLTDHFLPLRELAAGSRACASWVSEHSEEPSPFQLSERFLQIVWNEQRLRGDLATTDGRRLEVLAPGTWNVEAGPDFRDAVIRLGGETRSGDVEVHRSVSDWEGHGHHRDPLYRNVVLHVVWHRPTTERADGAPPCLEVAGALDRPWMTLLHELQTEAYPYARQVSPGSCAVKWAMADDSRLVRLLRVAGLARFEDKTVRIQRGIISKGAGQALYEGLFEALGYKANRDQFRQLAQQVPLATLRELPPGLAWEAALFGRAGLLPDPSVVKVAAGWGDHVRELWDAWWQQGGEALAIAWCKAGSRPFNSPERRLAAGVELLRASQLAPDEWLTRLAAPCESPRALLRVLAHELAVRSPWEPFKSFEVRLARPVLLLGCSRVHDLLVNVLLPFLSAQARRTGNAALAARAQEAYLLIPSLQANRALSEAVHRFLVPPSRGVALLRRACQQQGLLETYRSFCLALHNDCKNCPFGDFPVEHPSGVH